MSDKGIQVGYHFTNAKNQHYAAIVANILILGHGAMYGWVSPALTLLLSEDTPLKTGPLTNDQLSWVGSINALGAIFGTFTFGFVLIWFGCKRTLLFLTLPSVIFWVLIYIGDTYYYLLIARFDTGWIGGGLQISIILYISELANDDIRGRLNSFTALSRNIGILTAYIVGFIAPYEVNPCIFVFVPIIFGVWFFIFPNTPQYHLQRGQLEEAEESLKFYKGYKAGGADEVLAITFEFERLNAIANEQKTDEKIALKDFFNRKGLKGLTNGIVLASMVHLCASFVIVTYAAVIFENVGVTKMDPYISVVQIGVMQIIGPLCTSKFSDSLGRKKLLILSLLGSAFGLLLFALYSYLHESGYQMHHYEWIPVISLSFVIFTASAGVVPLVYLCIVENLPSKIRTIGLTICNVFMNLVSFICLKKFPVLMVLIGLHGCMLIFGVVSVLGSIYVFFMIEEKKGLALDTVKSISKNTEHTAENK